MSMLTVAAVLAVAVCGAVAVLSPAPNNLTWYDWDRQQVCHPYEYLVPTSAAEIVAAVQYAARQNMAVKVVGAGHSFSAIALTPQRGGIMLSLDNIKDVVSVNGTQVSVGAGIRLFELNAELEKRGLSLLNLGATCEQSLAGATATGTHGTGRLTGSISTQMVGLKMVLPNGTMVSATSTENTDLFEAGRVGLGALGIVYEITIQAEPLFKLELINTPMNLDDMLAKLPALMEQYERLQWFWDPYTTDATLVTRQVTDKPITGCWGQASTPALDLERPPTSGQATSCVDVSYKALCGSHTHYLERSLYTEMEMFIPAEMIYDAIRDFRAFQDSVLPKHNSSVSLFTGVRYVEADDIWLSPMHGRDIAVISMIVSGTREETGSPQEFEMYAQGLEHIMTTKYKGVPHWGKQNWALEADLAAVYTKLADFKALRASVDPTNLLMNEYLLQRIGA